MQKKKGKKNHVKDFVDEICKVFIVGALVSGDVAKELSGNGVRRLREIIEKGHDARGGQLACRAR
jgi:hypothetical protein